MSGKRRALSAEKITLKAVEMADADGLEAVSMRKLAGALNATAMSIYNHVKGKDELQVLMLDHVIEQFELPEVEGDWQLMLTRRAHSMREAFKRHNWAIELMVSKSVATETNLRDTDRVVGCLYNAGFSFQQADWAFNAIDSHVYGFTMQENNFPVGDHEYQSIAQQFLPQIPIEKFPHAHAAAKAVADGEYDGKTNFEFGLQLVLDGLARWLEDGPK